MGSMYSRNGIAPYSASVGSYGLQGQTNQLFGSQFASEAPQQVAAPSVGLVAPSSFGSFMGSRGAGTGADVNSDALGFGPNLGTGKLALGGIMGLGNLWTAFQSAGLAKKQFDFQKEFANTNLSNQIQSYNTALEDRSRSRAAVEGQSQSQADEYVNRNRATR